MLRTIVTPVLRPLDPTTGRQRVPVYCVGVFTLIGLPDRALRR